MAPPSGAAQAPLLPTLTALAPSVDAARASYVLPGSGFEAALFRADRRADVYSGAPVVAPLAGTGATVAGLAAGEHYFGLGVRTTNGTGPYAPAGAILRCRVGTAIYVDARSTASAPDGLTPATAYPALADGLLAAAVTGRNVLVREGTYPAVGLQLVSGVQVYGGFDAGFDLGGRDPVARASVLQGGAGQPIVVVGDAPSAAVLDGLVLDGLRAAIVGIDSADASFDVRATTVRNCVDRGLRARSSARTGGFRLRLAGCRLAENGTDGVSVSGPYDVEVHGCNLDANGEEGLDFDDLVALEGATANLVVEGCRFFGNGVEGLDCDLAAPLNPVTPGGVFDIRIRGSRFELNGADGLLIDQEFEGQPAWTAHVSVRECTARGNLRAGVHIDADATGDFLLHRLSATANGTDGVWLSSETAGGFATLGASVLMGNGGAGARASLGNKPLAVSHCVLAGNFGGGLVSDRVASTATSCIAYQQANAFGTAWQFGCSEVSAADTFLQAAQTFVQVTARVDTTLTLAAATTLPSGATLELADDRVERTASSASGTSVVLATAPSAVRLPSVLTVFATGAPAWEDFHLPTTSALRGTGFTTVSAGAVDPGPWGAPSAGFLGVGDDVAAAPPFRAVATTPALLHAHPAGQPLAVEFSAAIDSASLADRVRVRTRAGLELAVTLAVSGNTLTVTPPPAGFGGEPLGVELHRGLRAVSGDAFVCTVGVARGGHSVMACLHLSRPVP